MFNPRPTVTTLPITGQQVCVVVDDALVDPQALVDLGVKHHAALEPAALNAYPGIELPLPDSASARIADFFALHARRALGGRRTVRSHSRLSLVTLPPAALRPLQRVPHRDRLAVEPGQFVAASVLYLFHDPALGGTSFFVPRQSVDETKALMAHWNALSNDDFTGHFGREPAYITASSEHFDLVLTVAPRFNRMIFYDGGLFHCAHIAQPERLSDDPARGRLTVNPFFICTRAAAQGARAALPTRPSMQR